MLMGSLVDPSWELIDPTPDIHSLFLLYNDLFFDGKLSGCEVKWSPRMTLCAGLCSYEGRGGLCSIRLSKPLLTLRPRRDLVETLLHEMIHAYLFFTVKCRDRDSHGPDFQFHMNRINLIAGTKISVFHSFYAEVSNFKKHWWRCDGPCKNQGPFFGWVKRASNRAPSSNDFWWDRHKARCGGTFIKVKEPSGYGIKKKTGKVNIGISQKTLKSEKIFVNKLKQASLDSFYPEICHSLIEDGNANECVPSTVIECGIISSYSDTSSTNSSIANEMHMQQDNGIRFSSSISVLNNSKLGCEKSKKPVMICDGKVIAQGHGVNSSKNGVIKRNVKSPKVLPQKNSFKITTSRGSRTRFKTINFIENKRSEKNGESFKTLPKKGSDEIRTLTKLQPHSKIISKNGMVSGLPHSISSDSSSNDFSFQGIGYVLGSSIEEYNKASSNGFTSVTATSSLVSDVRISTSKSFPTEKFTAGLWNDSDDIVVVKEIGKSVNSRQLTEQSVQNVKYANVVCPVCNLSVCETLINIHLDTCLD